MRHVLVSSSDRRLADRLRESASPSTTFLAEHGLDATLERLSRSARIDAVVTDDEEICAAIREEIPGTIPVHVAAKGDSPPAILAALDALLEA